MVERGLRNRAMLNFKCSSTWSIIFEYLMAKFALCCVFPSETGASLRWSSATAVALAVGSNGVSCKICHDVGIEEMIEFAGLKRPRM